ncbi:metalloregulator ArsR/SmtB family transcription factor [Leifsonia shinshuensis]|nr:metalloregulator ArsR/SmtB family transcription factor [Leifsonia shinshuensis]
MDAQQVLAAIGEPTRFRIVVLLADGPRTVGELTSALGALQPQTTKHVQALEAAGVIRVQRLGRRRLASLDRAALRQLAGWIDRLAESTEDDRALDAYAAAVASAEQEATDGDGASVDFTLVRRLPASRSDVWHAWTDPLVAARWWAPRHFTVVGCAIEPTRGARVELILREGDGAEYTSAGTVREVEAQSRLAFELSPLDAEGRVLFPVEVDVRLEDGDGHADAGAVEGAVDGAVDGETTMTVTVRATTTEVSAAPMLAGLEPGWSQQVERLAGALEA